MAAESAELIGRDFEQAAILAALGESWSVVALTGEAGIGKTALWDRAMVDSRARGDHVLVSRASAAEARLPWVGLADLLRSIPPAVLDALPEVQRRALEAVSLHTGGVEALDERTVGTALLSALQALSESAPVLMAVDDLPYLDVASVSAVAFALRRVDGRHRVRLFATVRNQDLRQPLVPGVPAQRCTISTVGPLTLGALFGMLQNRSGIRLARPLLLRVHETSGGNPLYALELARSVGQ